MLVFLSILTIIACAAISIFVFMHKSDVGFGGLSSSKTALAPAKMDGLAKIIYTLFALVVVFCVIILNLNLGDIDGTSDLEQQLEQADVPLPVESDRVIPQTPE